jgi:hypothetical protein
MGLFLLPDSLPLVIFHLCENIWYGRLCIEVPLVHGCCLWCPLLHIFIIAYIWHSLQDIVTKGLLDNFLNHLKAFSGYGEQSLKLQIGMMTVSGRDEEKKLMADQLKPIR